MPPAQRREQGRPRRGDARQADIGSAEGIADASHQIGGADQACRGPIGAASGRQHLGDHRSGGNEEQPHRTDRCPGHERPGGGEAGGGETRGDRHSKRQVRAGAQQQRGHEGSGTGNRRGAEKFGAPELFIGACVPHDQEGAHQPGQNCGEGVALEEHHRADAGPVGEPTEEEERRARRGNGDDCPPLPLVPELPGYRGGGDEAQKRDTQDPPGKDAPVPAGLHEAQADDGGHQSSRPSGTA